MANAKRGTTARPAVPKNTIAFRYDAAHDVVIAEPDWDIQTEADVRAWFQQYETFLKRFNRKMDFVAVLDSFTIGPAIGAIWGEYRARLLRDWTRFNYRVHSNTRVKFFVNTSGVRYNVATQEAASVEDAIAAIHAERRAAGIE